jgi:uncharacterized membrane protein
MGDSPINRAFLPATLACGGTVVFRVTVTTEIERPAGPVYDFIADFTNNPEWQFGIESTEWTSEPPLGVGSTYQQTMEYKGQVIRYVVVNIDPGRSVSVQSQEGATIPTTVTRTVLKLNDSQCRVRVDLEGRLSGLRRLTQPLLPRVIRKSIRADYRRLKRLLETEPSEEPESDQD